MKKPRTESEARVAACLLEHPTPLARVVELTIETAIERSEGHMTRAAFSLGLSRSSLYRRLRRACRAPNTTESP